MSEKVAAPKQKKISKPKRAKQVRLWVRAKFMGFRRYPLPHPDPKWPRTSIRTSSASRESTIARPHSTTSASE